MPATAPSSRQLTTCCLKMEGLAPSEIADIDGSEMGWLCGIKHGLCFSELKSKSIVSRGTKL